MAGRYTICSYAQVRLCARRRASSAIIHIAMAQLSGFGLHFELGHSIRSRAAAGGAKMKRLAYALIVVGVTTGCGATPDGPSLGLSGTKVIFLADVADQSCDRSLLMLGRKTDDGYAIIRGVMVKGGSTGSTKPMVLTLTPGLYNIIKFSCVTDTGKIDIGGDQKDIFSPILKYRYASFEVKGEEMLNIGYLLFHLNGDRVAKVEVSDIPLQTRAVLKSKYPQEYQNMQLNLMQVDPSDEGDKLKVDS